MKNAIVKALTESMVVVESRENGVRVMVEVPSTMWYDLTDSYREVISKAVRVHFATMWTEVKELFHADIDLYDERDEQYWSEVMMWNAYIESAWDEHMREFDR